MSLNEHYVKWESMSLTVKQRAYAECYAGDGEKAAYQAGYKGSKNSISVTVTRLNKNEEVVKLIRARESKRLTPLIKTREERQEWWSTVMEDEELPTKDRLRASELLAKSQCDFITKTEVTYPDAVQYTSEEKKVLKQLALQRAKEIISDV